ncbi:ATP-binding cassette, subfamily C, exporter for protease/lipase [Methylobacillus rhizosphaerae]|uniref:ATP-binding cassette, subfamily C, exporter for protease/lipase n=2 Tax=Methylobacillus rhizosphaerae TaxID=551994 RepID=A0A238ZP77_9PROT|nr:ATP-binding cassette, subfamily C, exporter for protease/lipase [Methylobacillus rhizosphaerae]
MYQEILQELLLVTIHNPSLILKKALMGLAPHYRKVAFFGFFTNLMVLAPSWYMLEVYDRVIFSRNTNTLLMLTVMVVFIYLIMESLERVRRSMLQQSAAELDQSLNSKLFNAAFAARLNAADFPAQRVFTDYRSLREMLASPALIGMMDIPFILIFIIAIFLIHSSLGYLTLGGLVIQTVIASLNQMRVQPALQEANQHALAAQRYFGNIQQYAEVVRAMGMQAALETRWQDKQQGFLDHQAQASEIAGKYAAYSKFLQITQTSMVLGLGCYLAINQSLVNGAAMMIVASILAARVLAPFSQFIAQWRNLANALQAYERLSDLLEQHPAAQPGMELPAPSGQITVENLSYALADNPREPLLRNMQFRVAPGEVLLVTGPSASGKTTLSKALVGLLQPSTGKVRLDGVDVYQWDKEELGQHLGYLPQEIELLDGTIAENICRFGTPDVEQLQAVIELLKLQAWISTLPDGLETRIGHEGHLLSGGRRQLVGLARALYGKPAIVVLDEPNANLDEASEQRLQQAVYQLKTQNTTFVIISHLQGIKEIADTMMVMSKGQILRYGKPDEVIASLQQASKEARRKV